MARPKASLEQREEIRRGIHDVAAEIYRTFGVSGVTARAVARKADISVGTIYSYFGSLPGLMQSLWAERIGKQNVDFAKLAGQHDDALDRLTALLTAYLKYGFQNADLYHGAFLSQAPDGLAGLDSAPLDATDFPSLLMATLKAGQAAGQIIDGDPGLYAHIIWSGLHGCLALPSHIDRSAFAPAQEIAEPMVEALVRAVRRAPD